MHYHPKAFGLKIGQHWLTTLKAKRSGTTFGQRQKLSDLDVEDIDNFYNCKKGNYILYFIDRVHIKKISQTIMLSYNIYKMLSYYC